MAQVRVERLDHVGLIVSVINDWGLIDLIDTRLVPDTPDMLTPGEAVAGMRLKGLGFAHRPLSWTPRLFARNPLALWWREGIEAELGTRFQRGRTLDAASTDGGDRLVQELALAVCAQAGLALRCNHLDPTSCSPSGASVPASDAHAMTSPHGYSKDHRPDLPQAVLERMVSPDGGVPCVRQRWEGQTSDSHIFQARAQALRHAFTNTPGPRSLVTAATRDHADKASSRQRIGCLTRMPNTLGVVSPVIRPALGWDTWPLVADHPRDPPLEVCHAGMAQRWRVVSSQAACARAAATRQNATPRDDEASTPALVHLHAPRLPTPEAAPEALAAVAQRWRYHRVESAHRRAPTHDAGRGRPTPHPPLQAIAWQIQAPVRSDDATLAPHQHVKACCVLGTQIAASAWRHAEVIAASQGPSHVEGGFRCLNDPLLVVSSWFVKKPNRLAGLRMVMTLAWLVYSVAHRRLRTPWAKHHETVPNHIHPPTTSPTWRGVFQLLDGMHRVRVMGQGQVHDLIEGLNDVQIHILRWVGHTVCRLYHISAG